MAEFEVFIDHTHYNVPAPNWNITSPTPPAHNVTAVASFRADLDSWLAMNNASGKIVVVHEVPHFLIVIIECDQKYADALKIMPGVLQVNPHYEK